MRTAPSGACTPSWKTKNSPRIASPRKLGPGASPVLAPAALKGADAAGDQRRGRRSSIRMGTSRGSGGCREPPAGRGDRSDRGRLGRRRRHLHWEEGVLWRAGMRRQQRRRGASSPRQRGCSRACARAGGRRARGPKWKPCSSHAATRTTALAQSHGVVEGQVVEQGSGRRAGRRGRAQRGSRRAPTRRRQPSWLLMLSPDASSTSMRRRRSSIGKPGSRHWMRAQAVLLYLTRSRIGAAVHGGCPATSGHDEATLYKSSARLAAARIQRCRDGLVVCRSGRARTEAQVHEQRQGNNQSRSCSRSCCVAAWCAWLRAQ